MQVQLEHIQDNTHVDKKTTSQNTPTAKESGSISGYSLDISGKVMDNSAYKGQGKTAEEVMQEAGQQEVACQRNYMAVMSNIMSDEDFSKLSEEGFEPGSTEIETVVTIVDEIKATLAKSGVEIKGYTDTLDSKKLEEITGSKAQAAAVEQKLEENDLPVTRENLEAIENALVAGEQLTQLTNGSIKYMVENQLEPTIDNLYKAQFSASGDGSRQGKGYYSDAFPGYYSKKADSYNWEQLESQMKNVIEEAGMEVNEETLDSSKWLIEKGIPLTADSLTSLEDLKQLKLPQSSEQLTATIVTAMSNGKSAKNANLSGEISYLNQAKQLIEEVDSITESAVEKVVTQGRELTLENLLLANNTITTADLEPSVNESIEVIAARRQLEEVRLKMTVQANIKMLKQGISIDTTQLEELVENLKNLEKQTASALFKEEEDTALDKLSLYKETLEKRAEIATMPAALIGKFAQSYTSNVVTVADIYKEGTVLKNTYQAASQTYEALMTAPRKDLGDSIKTAFRNVEELLTQMDIEPSESNQRAARILGYNAMEITAENIQTVKTADLSIQRVIEKMTPQATLNMIREGINPLSTDMQQLEQYLDENQPATAKSEEFAKYLYKLEQQGLITKEEKESYIGVFRLVHQIEKSDGAVVGSLVNQGAELSFQNLLSAVRTSKSKGIEVRIDDDFGTLKQVVANGSSISDQIASYYNSLVSQTADLLDGERITKLNLTQDTTLEELNQMLKNTEMQTDLENSYFSEEIDQLRQGDQIEDYVIKTLLDYEQPITMNNLLATNTLMNQRGSVYQKLTKTTEKLDDKNKATMSEELKAAMDNIGESLETKDSMEKAFDKLETISLKLTEELMDSSEVTSVDVKSLNLVYKQLAVATGLAKEENYEIPVTINGELTSVNLRILHNQGEKGKVSATLSTEKLGKVAAEFQVTKDSVSGLVAGDFKQGIESLEQIESSLKQGLKSLDKNSCEIKFIYSQGLNIQSFGNREKTEVSQDNAEDVTTVELYKIAKTFISSLNTIDKEGVANEY